MAAGHRGAGVDEERDREVLLLDEELDEEALEPGVDVPVELAQVVAEGVVAVVGELHGLAPLDAPPAALQAAPHRRPDEQQQALELAQERLVEHGRVELGGQEDLRAPGARRPRPAGRRSWDGRRPGYSTVAGWTASRIVRTTASGVIPSASPSKLRMSRWRSAGRAASRISSTDTFERPSSRAKILPAVTSAWAPRGEPP